MSACNRYHLLLSGSTRSDQVRGRMIKYGDIFQWLRFQLSTFNVQRRPLQYSLAWTHIHVRYTTPFAVAVYVYRCRPHILPQIPARSSHRQESPLGPVMIPLDVSHSRLPPHAQRGARNGTQDPHGRAHARPPRAAPPRPAQAWPPPAGGVIAQRHTRRETYVSRTACRGDRLGGIVFCARSVWYGMVLCYETHAPVR